MQLVSASEMRQLDELTIQHSGEPGRVLMERAGAGATQVLLTQSPHVLRRRVVVVAGRGNNGGDGLVMARLLRRGGVRAEVVLLARQDDVTGDAAHALTAMRRARVPIVELPGDVGAVRARLSGAALIVDAVLGTGLNAPVKGFYAGVIEAMNVNGAPLFAVDMPSGLDADRGVPLGPCVRAKATATFGFAKLGQVVYPGIEFVGALTVVDIGIAASAIAEVRPRSWLLEANDLARLVPSRSPEAHKGTCGHAVILAGSRGHTGAARLVGQAACRSGAGLTTLAGPASLNAVLSGDSPELMTMPLPDDDGFMRFEESALRAVLAGKNAVVIGPGMGTHADADRIIRFCLRETQAAIVLDADALTSVARDLTVLRPAQGRLILTPHPGEMARLNGTDTTAVQADRINAARAFATAHKCVLILKGARTVIAAPNGDLWINPTGNAGMASGGMGDALAGILGGLLAQGLDAADAARLGVYVHGAAADQLAADYAPTGYLASDVIREVPRRLAALRADQISAASPSIRRRRG